MLALSLLATLLLGEKLSLLQLARSAMGGLNTRTHAQLLLFLAQ